MDEIMRLVRPAIAQMTPYSAARTEGRQIARKSQHRRSSGGTFKGFAGPYHVPCGD
jgi:hypothetical protein